MLSIIPVKICEENGQVKSKVKREVCSDATWSFQGG